MDRAVIVAVKGTSLAVEVRSQLSIANDIQHSGANYIQYTQTLGG